MGCGIGQKNINLIIVILGVFSYLFTVARGRENPAAADPI
jgi:hypothetical protein